MKIFFTSIVLLLFPFIIQAQPPLTGVNWSPATQGIAGQSLVLEAVTGTKKNDVVSYIKVRGPCKFRKGKAKARRTLVFSGTGTCVVRAKVQRKGHATWNSGNKKITVTAVLSMIGISWSPATSGTVGTELVLDPVSGTRNEDRVTYSVVSGACSFGSGSNVAERTLSFTKAETCVVKATVERSSNSTWNSLKKSITVTAPPRLNKVSWSPATTGTVGTNLILDNVSGTKKNDIVTYIKVSGSCKFRKGKAKFRRTLVFSAPGSCVVRATVKRKGYAIWNSGNKTITVTATLSSAKITWSPANSGTVGIELVLDPVSGTHSGDTITYVWVSGQCNFIGGNPLTARTLSFTGAGDCVVKATVERNGQNVWDSGNHTVTIIKGTIADIDWNPATIGAVGTPLVLDPVGNTDNSDVVTYTRVSGDCRFGNGSDVAERTLTFTRTETCVVEATVERPGYTTWNSGHKSINIGRGILTNISWNPITSGQVDKSLTLAPVQGANTNDRVSYTVINGSCYFGIGTHVARRTLMFPRIETCFVQARLVRTGYEPWVSRHRSIVVAAGTIKGVTWTPTETGRVGAPLVLDAVTGARNTDTVTYVRISGNCNFGSGDDTAERTLTFTDAGSCVVKAQVERPQYNTWYSKAKTITVRLRELTGVSWNPATQGSVGTPLVLPPATGTQSGDTIVYSVIYGNCQLGNSNDTAKRTLTFSDKGSCMVQVTIERTGHEPWSSPRLIQVSAGSLNGLTWNPPASGTVGIPLILDPVSGIQAGDTVTYAKVSGSCDFGSGSGTDERTLTFTRTETCVVRALVERPGYTSWESGYKSITVNGTGGMAQNGVQKIFSSQAAFAALKGDGSVVTWGAYHYGGNSDRVARQLKSNVKEIFTSQSAFAALKNDGSVVTWGYSRNGGDSSNVSSQLSGGVTKIVSTDRAFAAIKNDGSIVTWGDPHYGGDMTSESLLGDRTSVSDQLTSGVRDIFSTLAAFIALKNNGSVVAWGNGFSGGDSSDVSYHVSSGVEKIFTAAQVVTALKTGGTLITWGSPYYGGNSSSVSRKLTSGVVEVFSNPNAMVALKNDGSLVVWGHQSGGGQPDRLTLASLRSGVKKVFSTEKAFAALKNNGSVVVWGDSSYGSNATAVATKLQSGVVEIFSTERAFSALKSDGSVVVWGDPSYGGDATPVATDLQSGVAKIFSTKKAFAALKSNGSVVVWGEASHGGDPSLVASELKSSVVEIFSTEHSFAALKGDRTVVAWGDRYNGGSTRVVDDQLNGN